jgi:hypothetical protein
MYYCPCVVCTPLDMSLEKGSWKLESTLILLECGIKKIYFLYSRISFQFFVLFKNISKQSKPLLTEIFFKQELQ